jgi:hypothetical protein
VKMHVSSLIDAGVKAEDIAVVTPYNAQVRIDLHLPALTYYVRA